jgi:hypothetical protein
MRVIYLVVPVDLVKISGLRPGGAGHEWHEKQEDGCACNEGGKIQWL